MKDLIDKLKKIAKDHGCIMSLMPDGTISFKEMPTSFKASDISLKPNHYSHIPFSKSDKWQVKKAEPKIYDSAEEAILNLYDEPDLQENFIHCFQEGDKNGQLKEWKRTEKFREAAMKWSSQQAGNIDRLSHASRNLIHELMALKPPKIQ